MAITPRHPLTMEDRALSRNELEEVIRHEGLLGLDERDRDAAEELVREGIVEITKLHEVPHITLLDCPWLVEEC